MKKQTTRKKAQPLAVSRKFYESIMSRVGSAMAAIGADGGKIAETEVYVKEYLTSGLEPKCRLSDMQRLVVLLLKAEIDKAIVRSAKARERRSKKSVELREENIGDGNCVEAQDGLSDSQQPEVTEILLNRRERRLREQQLRREARKRRRPSIRALGGI